MFGLTHGKLHRVIFVPVRNTVDLSPGTPEVNRLGHYTVSSDGPVDPIELTQMWLSRAHLLGLLPCRLPCKALAVVRLPVPPAVIHWAPLGKSRACLCHLN
ncbi:unnamed protein product [Rangifer tarandus platyrhynchus]|uniref:Uncharacterized protein n=2 Tax=Rangifer tarandus platyrhynchus TaxID=3082113 RepID=A0AC59Y3J7_RANTA|nr:unnamed protein product [Rangifer tarandus platyrhynchus]